VDVDKEIMSILINICLGDLGRICMLLEGRYDIDTSSNDHVDRLGVLPEHTVRPSLMDKEELTTLSNGR
jgi:hypothetical protein